MIRNVIFDWCGTLVDDLPAVWRATNRVFAEAGVPALTLQQFRSEFVLPFKPFYDRFVRHVPLDQLEESFHRFFNEEQVTVAPMRHARGFLEFCRERELRAFVLSAIHPRHFTVHLGLTDFDQFFEKPYVGVLDKRDQIRQMLVEHDLLPEETLFVGDMQHDIETARYGGTQACAVLTGFNGVEQLRASEPDLIVEHLGELQGILQDNGMRLEPSNPAKLDSSMPVSTVGALVFNDRDEVLMIRTQKWSNRWGIPGGKIRYGESSVDALRREIHEETGLEIEAIEFILVQDAIRPEEFYREAHFILLNYTCRTVGDTAVTLNDEAQEYSWLGLEEALELDLNQPTRILINAVMQKRALVCA